MRRPAPIADERPLILIYDGQCSFCRTQVARLVDRVHPTRIELRSYHDSDALDGISGVTKAACERAMHLVEPSGRVSAGADAVVRIMHHSRRWRWIALLTWIPGVQAILRWGYARIARRRYRLGNACENGSCSTRL